MSHIEFIGPPGSGKSTLHAKLTEKTRYYGVEEQEVIRRMITTKQQKYRILYELTHLVYGQKLIDNILYKYYRGEAFERILEDTDIIKLLAYISKQVDKDPSEAVTYCKKKAEECQLGRQTIDSEELLCLDEGIMMAVAGTIFRSDDVDIEVEELTQWVPIPEVLIYVRTPTKVCLRRDSERASSRWGNKKDKKRIHERHRMACHRVVDKMNSRARVITIQGTGSVDKKVTTLDRKLRSIYR